MPTDSPPPSWQEDPVYQHGRREAIFVLSVWACCFVYTVSYSYLYGYVVHVPDPASTGPSPADLVGPLEAWNRDPASVTYPWGLGIPDWVFYGVVLPWCVCFVLSLWYVFAFFVEDDLGEEWEEPAGEAVDDAVPRVGGETAP